MGWQDAPLVESGGWKSAPLVEQPQQSIKPDAPEPGFVAGLGRGAAERLLGGAQFLNDIGLGSHIGIPDNETLNTAVKISKERGKGTGFSGTAGEILGDPLTLASTLLPGGSVAKFALQQGGASALGGATAPMENSNLKDRAVNTAIDTGIGTALGGVFGKINNPVQKLNPEMSRLAGVAGNEGIDLTPAQATGSTALRGIENAFSALPLTSGTQAKIAEDQAKQFNKAILQRAGIEADTATPDVLKAAKDNLSQQYSNISGRTSVNVDTDLLDKLGNIEKEASKRLGPDHSKAVSSFIDDVLETGGTIPGDVYQNTRSKLGQMANGTNDGFVKSLLKNTQQALDEAAERSLNPEDAQEWKQLRKQYGAYKTIEKAMGSTSNQALSGNISPGALATAAKTANKNYATGAGELNDLARVGGAFLRDPINNSGTAHRLLYQGLLTAPTAVAGAAGASDGGGMEGGIEGAALALAAPKLIQSVYGRKVVQDYLTKGINGGLIPAAEHMLTTSLSDRAKIDKKSNELKQSLLPPSVPVQQPAMPTTSPTNLRQFNKAEGSPDYSAVSPHKGAPTTYGAYQFQEATLNNLIKKYGNELGVNKDNWQEPQNQDKLAEALKEENAKAIRPALGREPTNTDLYVAHFLGAKDAKKFFKNINSNGSAAAMLPAVARANRGRFFAKDGRPLTPMGVYQQIAQEMGA